MESRSYATSKMRYHRHQPYRFLCLCVLVILTTTCAQQQQGQHQSQEEENEVAVVTCDTTKGTLEMTFYRDWSPNGYGRVLKLFQDGFYDSTHFFRVVSNFLVQFGISYTTSEELKTSSKTPIPDDPIDKRIPFEPGTISFAGSGPNSRTSHLFISLGENSGNQFGSNPWESPVGKVTNGLEEVVYKLHSEYGDMPPWGNGPDQQPIYNGPEYIEKNFPLLDKFLTCRVETKLVQGSNIPTHVKTPVETTAGNGPGEATVENDSSDDDSDDSNDNDDDANSDSDDSDEDSDSDSSDEL